MRTIAVILAVLLGLLSAAYPQRQANEPPLSIADLNKGRVIGRLHLPLGSPVEIEATIIAGRELRMKQFAAQYLLRVTRVQGKRLEGEPIMGFRAPTYTGVNLPRDPFELYELKNNWKKTGQLTDAQIAQLEKGYVGATVRLLVYESGGFSGRPNLPPDAPNWQDHGFYFSTWLEVMAMHKSQPQFPWPPAS